MNAIFEFFSHYQQLIGLVTFVICLIGFVLINRMRRYFQGSQHHLSQKMARVYLWDSYKFAITAVFGLAGFVDAPQWFWHLAYFLRPFILLFLLISLYDLFKTFRKISKE